MVRYRLCAQQSCHRCSHSRAPGEQWARLCVFTFQGCAQAVRLCRGSHVSVVFSQRFQIAALPCSGSGSLVQFLSHAKVVILRICNVSCVWRLRLWCLSLTPCDVCVIVERPWWRHQMETFSALLANCAGNSPATDEFRAQSPVTRSFDVFFDLPLNERLSKHSWGWWFVTLSGPLWRHSNAVHHNWNCFMDQQAWHLPCVVFSKEQAKPILSPRFYNDINRHL